MPHVTFRYPSGETKTIDGSDGESLMEAGRKGGVSEIIAECGGALSCATCHVYIDADWLSKVPPPEEDEKDMLEVVPELRAGSRLSCQIMLSDALDGLLVELPASQW